MHCSAEGGNRQHHIFQGKILFVSVQLTFANTPNMLERWGVRISYCFHYKHQRSQRVVLDRGCAKNDR